MKCFNLIGQKTFICTTAAVPSGGSEYTITFNRLVNPSHSYPPAFGLVDLKYAFRYNVHHYIYAFSSAPTNDTSFRITVAAFTATTYLARFSINYLAVSKDMKQFYLRYIQKQLGISRIVNQASPYTVISGISPALPSTADIKVVVLVRGISLIINQTPVYLFDYQAIVTIIDVANFQITVSSNLTNTQFEGLYYFFIIFYQSVSIPYSFVLQTQINFNSATAANVTNQVVYSLNSADPYEVSSYNTFFALSGIASVLSADFTVSYLTNAQMGLSVRDTKVLRGVILTFRFPQCPPGYIISSTQALCVCNNLTCYDGIDCSSVVAANRNASECLMCSILGNFVKDFNGNCVCKVGYQLKNQTCQEVCGDGIKFQDQCDDANKQSGDGCSSTCYLEQGFQCNQNFVGTSVCLFQKNICFKLASIDKNADNSAIFTFQAIGSSFPFALNSFEAFKTFNITVSRNRSGNNLDNYFIDYRMVDVYGQTIKVFVDFNETIEGANALIKFNFNQTKYLSQDCTLKFNCIGSLMPLVITQYAEQYKTIQTLNLIQVVFVCIIFVLSMFAPKWIGVQTMQTIQLVYFSQLLITDVSNWPSAFSVFKYFKYSNGINFFSVKNVSATSVISSKKWILLQFCSIFIQNFLLNFLLILLFVSVFIIIAIIRQCKQQKYSQKPQNKKNQEIKQTIGSISNKSQRAYQVILNVVVWSILQFIASIFSQYLLLDNVNNNFDILISRQLNALSILFSLSCILLVCANNFLNMYHNQYTQRKLQIKSELLRYKFVNNLYHILLGSAIICFNDKSILAIPMSALIILCQLAYIIYIYKCQPYKQCLKVHSIGMLVNRLVFLVFLGFVTLKNVVVDINEIFMLGMCFLIVGSIFVVITFGFIRLYYDIRYGQELQKKLKLQRQAKELNQLKLEKQREEAKLDKIKQNDFKYKTNKNQQIRKDNIYLYQNQVQEYQQREHLQWLDKSKIMTKEQKDTNYYAKYSEKPLEWVKQHNAKQYQRRMSQKETTNSKKQTNKKDDKQLIKLKQQLRKDLIHKRFVKKNKIKRK